MLIAHVSLLEPDSADGVNQTIRGLCRHLSDLGVMVERWHLNGKADRVAQSQVDGIGQVTLPCHRGMWRNLRGLPRATRDYVAARSREVDVVHLHSVFLPQNLAIARLCRRYVVTPHGGYGATLLGRHRMLKQLWMSLWERQYLCRAAAVHAVSPQERRQIEAIDPKIRAVCIANGVDESLLQRPVEDPGGGRFWLYLGRLAVEQKGLDLLLEGYAQVKHEGGALVPPLILAGGDYQGGRDRLKQRVQELKLTHSVEFAGPVLGQGKWDLLASAGLFIHSSRWEGMPFAVLEALAIGRPVLITPETNLAMQVTHYGAGWVVQGSSSAIAAGLRAVMACGAEPLDAMGQAARRLAADCLTWPAIAREMLAVYRGATSQTLLLQSGTADDCRE